MESTKSYEPRRPNCSARKYDEIQETLDHDDAKAPASGQLANRCIYGTDANDRMARTSKMNMIMHGDGHGGVHHHDGFLNVNGIFEDRFDIILTNPPFGANVEPATSFSNEQSKVPDEVHKRYVRRIRRLYKEAMAACTGRQGQTHRQTVRSAQRAQGRTARSRPKSSSSSAA